MPGKNLRKLAGIPLVAWAIRRAQGAARLEGCGTPDRQYRVVISTDSEDIAAVAREWGADVLIRPAELATDETSAEDVMKHALSHYHAQEAVWVQPTSPLATARDLQRVVRYFHSRQEAVYSTAVGTDRRPNGAAYAMWGCNPKFKGFVSEMPRSRSVDIDTEDDWHMAEALLAARPVAPFNISNRDIGPGHPCFVIAEAGINHGGDPAKAHALVDAAGDAGADAVKFQTFQPELLAEPGPHLDLLRSVHLQCCEYDALKVHAEERGLIFLSSPFDEPSVDLLDSIGVPAFKIPSGEIVNLPLLRHVASKGKPVILSTGMSTMREVAAAVDALSGVPVALLHCVSEYPTDISHTNLSAMDTMRQAFGVPVGWSDHTGIISVAPVAAAMGASIVEAHLLPKGVFDGPDADASLSPTEFRSIVYDIRGAETLRGTGEKVPTPGELETAKVARRRDGLRRNQ